MARSGVDAIGNTTDTPGKSGDRTAIALLKAIARDMEDAPIAQGASGTTEIVAAVADKRIYVVSYVFTMSAEGTAKFTDGTEDLSGAFDIVARGGVSAIGQPSSHLFKTHDVNRPLNIVTTGGSAKGHVAYFTA